MSTTTNIIAGLKQLFHGKGASSIDVSDSVDKIARKEVQVYLESATTNISVNYKVEGDQKLISAFLSPTVATASSVANTVFFTIQTNGVTVANVNTDGDSLNATAVGQYYDLSVNAVNAFVDSGEYVVVSCLHQEGNAAGGMVTLRFEPA